MAKFNLDDYKEEEQIEKVDYKDPQYVALPECFQKCLGFPGILLGASTMFYGLSDSGKTISMLHMAKACLEQQVLPILIITENKLDVKLIDKVGLDLTKCILREDLTTLEDVFDYIAQKIAHVKEGKLPYNVMFFWDSVASTPSKDSFELEKDGTISKKFGPQKNAAVIGYYNPIIMKMVTSTKRKEYDYTVGLVLLNQAYIAPSMMPGTPPSVVPNGGEKIWYPLSLGVELKEGQRLSATIKGRKYDYALVSKLRVKKNHISDLNASGELVFAGSEVFENTPSNLNNYKERMKEVWTQNLDALEQLNECKD